MAEPPAAPGPERLLWPDAARTLACALVVLVHVDFLTRPTLADWWPGGLAFAPAFGLTVPVFFAVAGFFERVPARGGALPPAGAYLAGTARRLGVPLVAWGAVLVALGTESETSDPWALAAQVVTGPWHLYFLFALFQLKVGTWALGAWRRRRGVEGASWRVRLALAAAAALATHAACEAALWSLGGPSEVVGYHARRLFTLWVPYFVLGRWLRHDPTAWDRLGRAWPAIAGLALAGFAGWVWELVCVDAWLGWEPQHQTLLAGLPAGLFGTLAILMLLRRMEAAGPRTRRWVARLARFSGDTYPVYLVHTALLTVLYRAFQRSPAYVTDAWTVPLLWVLVTALSLALVRLLRLPGARLVGRWVLGER